MGAAEALERNWLQAGNQVANDHWGHLGSEARCNYDSHVQNMCTGLGLDAHWAMANKAPTVIVAEATIDPMQKALEQYRSSEPKSGSPASLARPATPAPEGRTLV